jgi:hypothetical protein
MPVGAGKGTAEKACATGTHDYAPARHRRRASPSDIFFIPDSIDIPSHIGCAGSMVALRAAAVRTDCGKSVAPSRRSGEKSLGGETQRWYCCHVMLAFGIVCKGLTYY